MTECFWHEVLTQVLGNGMFLKCSSMTWKGDRMYRMFVECNQLTENNVTVCDTIYYCVF